MKNVVKVFQTDLSKEFYTEEGCHIVEILNDPSSPHISLARARVEVGKKPRLHALTSTTEVYHIIQGQGRVYIDGQEREVMPGDTVVIQPDIDQSIINTGQDDLIFLCLCHPRFDSSNYTDTEE